MMRTWFLCVFSPLTYFELREVIFGITLLALTIFINVWVSGISIEC